MDNENYVAKKAHVCPDVQVITRLRPITAAPETSQNTDEPPRVSYVVDSTSDDGLCVLR